MSDSDAQTRWALLAVDAFQIGPDAVPAMTRAVLAVLDLPDDADGQAVELARAADPRSNEELAAEYLAAYHSAVDL